MTYAEQVKEAIDTLIDVCAYHEGCNCAECEAKDLCKCTKPLDLLSSEKDNKVNQCAKRVTTDNYSYQRSAPNFRPYALTQKIFALNRYVS